MSAQQPVSSREDRRLLGARVVGWTRFMALVPTTGLLIGAVLVMIAGTWKTVALVIETVSNPSDTKHILVGVVEAADTFLLGIVIYIIALGIFSLFIEDRVPLPEWLEFHNLEDLKEKLIGVVVVVLAVFFLGRVIEARSVDYLQIMYLGLGIAGMVVALGYFVKSALKHVQ